MSSRFENGVGIECIVNVVLSLSEAGLKKNGTCRLRVPSLSPECALSLAPGRCTRVERDRGRSVSYRGSAFLVVDRRAGENRE